MISYVLTPYQEEEEDKDLNAVIEEEVVETPVPVTPKKCPPKSKVLFTTTWYCNALKMSDLLYSSYVQQQFNPTVDSIFLLYDLYYLLKSFF